VSKVDTLHKPNIHGKFYIALVKNLNKLVTNLAMDSAILLSALLPTQYLEALTDKQVNDCLRLADHIDVDWLVDVQLKYGKKGANAIK